MSESKLEAAKKVIRSILIPMKSGCTLSEFRREYSTIIGRPIPASEFGYGRDEASFLRSIPDVVRVQQGFGNEYYLTAVADETTRHIQKMVERQKPQKRKTAKVAQKWRQPPPSRRAWTPQMPPRLMAYVVPPRHLTQEKRLSRTLKVRIVEMVRKQQEINLTDFLREFQKSYGEKFAFQSFGFFTLQECIETIPELALKTVNNVISIRYVGGQPPGADASRFSEHKVVEYGNVNSSATSRAKTPNPVERNAPFPEAPFSGNVNSGAISHIKSPPNPVERKTQFPVVPISDKRNSTSTATSAMEMSYVILEDSTKPLLPSFHDKPAFSSPKIEDPFRNSHTSKEMEGRLLDLPVFVGPNEEIQPPTENNMSLHSEVASSLTASSALNSSQGEEPEEVPLFVLNNLKKIAAMYPQGIWATDFPALYEDVIKTDFDLHSLGYNDLSLFIDAVSHIFKREDIGGIKNNWLIVPTDAIQGLTPSPNSSAELVTSVVTNSKRILQAYPEGIKLEEFLHIYSINCAEPLNIKTFGFQSVETFLSSIASRVPLMIASSREGKSVHLIQTPVERVFQFAPSTEVVPFDAVVPPFSIPTTSLPEDMDYSKYFEVYTSSIESPSHFYIQVKGPQYSEAMNALYNSIESFYHSPESEQYKMRNAHIKVGTVCVALWPSDQHWYRVKVMSISSMESVKVFYFDYGTREEIPITMLRYMRKEYSRLPAQALVASLACLRPAHQAPIWDPRARALMLRLCLDVSLMASVDRISEEGVLSLILCDTNGDRDTYINDVLLNEGLADCAEATPLRTPSPVQSPEALKQLQAQLLMQACASMVAPADMARMFQGLSLNGPSVLRPQPLQPPVPPPVPVSGYLNDPYRDELKSPSPTESEVFGDEDDKFFDQFYSKVVTVMKRYVKRVMTNDGYIFHILILDSRPYVSCGDISNLIWSGQDSEYLVQRLQNREVKLPSLTVSETENKELFNQIQRFFVKGCQNVGNTSQIFVYSLDSVIEILNLFGQPSEDLRKRIQGELVSFNPRDPQWQELSEAEFPEAEEVSVVTDDDKLNRLCLYDLLAMKESIRIRRTNKMRNLMSSTTRVDEVGKMEQLLDRVVDRIEQIKKICGNYK